MRSTSHNSTGGLGLILLTCLAVPLVFVTFGFGAVNLATDPSTASEEELDSKNAQLEQLRESFTKARQDRQSASVELAAARQALGMERDQRDEAARLVQEATAVADELRRQLAKADSRLEELRKAREKRQAVRVGQLYGSGDYGKTPVWVECLDGAVILQPGGRRMTVSELRRDPSSFRSAIQKTTYAVFLVRPDGFDSFEEARDLAEKGNVTVGYEPVDGDWVLDFGEETS